MEFGVGAVGRLEGSEMDCFLLDLGRGGEVEHERGVKVAAGGGKMGTSG